MIEGAQNFHIFSIKSHQSCRMFTHDDLDAVNHVRHENTLFDDPPNPVLNTKQHIQACPPCSRTLWRHHTAVTLRRAEEVMTLSRPYYPCLIITPGFPSCTCPSTSTVKCKHRENSNHARSDTSTWLKARSARWRYECCWAVNSVHVHVHRQMTHSTKSWIKTTVVFFS